MPLSALTLVILIPPAPSTNILMVPLGPVTTHTPTPNSTFINHLGSKGASDSTRPGGPRTEVTLDDVG